LSEHSEATRLKVASSCCTWSSSLAVVVADVADDEDEEEEEEDDDAGAVGVVVVLLLLLLLEAEEEGGGGAGSEPPPTHAAKASMASFISALPTPPVRSKLARLTPWLLNCLMASSSASGSDMSNSSTFSCTHSSKVSCEMRFVLLALMILGGKEV